MTQGVLVVGYGNALRADDGLGWHVAERLADDPRLTGATVLRRHQLTPELALDISEATLVVLVDASHGPAAGTITVERLEPAVDPGPSGTSGSAAPSGTTWSHHLTPATLVALARELYGRAPDVFVVGCGVASVEMGDELSPKIRDALPRVVDAVAELVASQVARGDVQVTQDA